VTHWFEFFGRLHPMVLHLPIGLIVGLIALEGFALVRRKPAPREVTVPLAWFAAAVAVFSAASGFVLSYEGQFSGPTLDNHLRFGIAVAIATVICALVYSRARSPAPHRAALLATAALLIPAGHLGASLTHGEDFLTAPFDSRDGAARPSMSGEVTPVADSSAVGTQPGDAPVFASTIAPIFEARCLSCHGSPRGKGGLRLDEPDRITKGGRHGVILVAGKPDESEILRRLRLPRDADGHMPPADKPQLDEAQIAAIETWIAAGANFDTAPETTPVPEVIIADSATPGDEPTATDGDLALDVPAVAPPPDEALDALARRLVHVERIAAGSNLLWIDFAAIAGTLTDADARELLSPLAEQVADLSLARASITDECMTAIAKLPNLRRLDLRETKITDASVGALRDHPKLAQLTLSQTRLSDSIVDALIAMPALRDVHVWQAGLTVEAIDRLRREKPELRVITGQEVDAAALEAESDLKFTGDAPVPGQSAAAASLKPVNTKCPVLGTPIDPKYSIVFNGKVIGFCCQNCPKEFWSDPAKFESKLE
jgi:mono/diheme cytochrome c family protein/uncharacterized membrane protein